MSYFMSKVVEHDIETTIDAVRDELSKEGFGVLMDLNIQETLISKTGSDIGAYRVLGACNPTFAQKAIAAEPSIGTMLPCNILVRSLGPQQTEVDVIDPVASMQAVQNPALAELAAGVRSRLSAVVERVGV